MKINETTFLGRTGVEIVDDYKKIFITNELGGRILYYGTEDFNILHENEFKDAEISQSNLKETREKLGWNDFGGYKTWLAPQTNWDGPPYLDLDRGIYEMNWEKLENNDVKIVCTSPICRETGMQIKREIIIYKNSTKMDVNHILTSTTENDCKWGIWDVTQVKKPCISIIKGELNQYELFGEESKETDFLKIENGVITAIAPANEKRGYKGYFLSESDGFSTEFEINGKTITYLKEFNMKRLYEYAHKSNIEVYSDFNKNYAELEAHSPLFTFGKENKSNYFNITWSFKID